MKGSSRRNCVSLPVKCIPQNIAGESLIDVIRTVISLGSACNTLTAIAGSIAEAFMVYQTICRMNVSKYCLMI